MPRLPEAVERLRYRRAHGFDPPPRWSEITGYEPMLEVLRSLEPVPGDVLEIGVLAGGGTYKLAKAAPQRTVIAVDVFDLRFDHTASDDGTAMADIYDRHFKGAGFTGTQREVFDRITAGLPNLTVIEGDSTQVEIPADRLAFSFVDGHHAPEYVRKDFATAWSRTSPGGVVAMHDYGADLPGVTRAIHALIGAHADEIARTWTERNTIYLQRVGTPALG